jgi:hypothetical protein
MNDRKHHIVLVAALAFFACDPIEPASPEFVTCSTAMETEHEPCKGDGFEGTCFGGICVGVCTHFEQCPLWQCHGRGCVEGFCRYEAHDDGVYCAVGDVVGECMDTSCVLPGASP